MEYSRFYKCLLLASVAMFSCSTKVEAGRFDDFIDWVSGRTTINVAHPTSPKKPKNSQKFSEVGRALIEDLPFSDTDVQSGSLEGERFIINQDADHPDSLRSFSLFDQERQLHYIKEEGVGKRGKKILYFDPQADAPYWKKNGEWYVTAPYIFGYSKEKYSTREALEKRLDTLFQARLLKYKSSSCKILSRAPEGVILQAGEETTFASNAHDIHRFYLKHDLKSYAAYLYEGEEAPSLWKSLGLLAMIVGAEVVDGINVQKLIPSRDVEDQKIESQGGMNFVEMALMTTTAFAAPKLLPIYLLFRASQSLGVKGDESVYCDNGLCAEKIPNKLIKKYDNSTTNISNTHIISGIYYHIKNFNGQYLEANCNAKNHLSDRDHNSNQSDQFFSFVQDGPFFKIKVKPRTAKTSGNQCVEAYCDHSTRVCIRECEDNDGDQLFSLIQDGDYVRLFNPRFLEIDCDEGDGTRAVAIRRYKNTPDQRFTWDKDSNRIKNEGGRYLEAHCNGKDLLNDREYRASNDQWFTFEEKGPFYKIKVKDGAYVEAYCNGSNRVCMRNENDVPDQLFGKAQYENYFRIFNPKFLEINCDAGNDHQKSVAIRESRSSNDQKFKVYSPHYKISGLMKDFTYEVNDIFNSLKNLDLWVSAEIDNSIGTQPLTQSIQHTKSRETSYSWSFAESETSSISHNWNIEIKTAKKINSGLHGASAVGYSGGTEISKTLEKGQEISHSESEVHEIKSDVTVGPGEIRVAVFTVTSMENAPIKFTAAVKYTVHADRMTTDGLIAQKDEITNPEVIKSLLKYEGYKTELREENGQIFGNLSGTYRANYGVSTKLKILPPKDLNKN